MQSCTTVTKIKIKDAYIDKSLQANKRLNLLLVRDMKLREAIQRIN